MTGLWTRRKSKARRYYSHLGGCASKIFAAVFAYACQRVVVARRQVMVVRRDVVVVRSKVAVTCQDLVVLCQDVVVVRQEVNTDGKPASASAAAGE